MSYFSLQKVILLIGHVFCESPSAFWWTMITFKAHFQKVEVEKEVGHVCSRWGWLCSWGPLGNSTLNRFWQWYLAILAHNYSHASERQLCYNNKINVSGIAVNQSAQRIHCWNNHPSFARKWTLLTGQIGQPSQILPLASPHWAFLPQKSEQFMCPCKIRIIRN